MTKPQFKIPSPYNKRLNLESNMGSEKSPFNIHDKAQLTCRCLILFDAGVPVVDSVGRRPR
jgi:hypothetical protein